MAKKKAFKKWTYIEEPRILAFRQLHARFPMRLERPHPMVTSRRRLEAWVTADPKRVLANVTIFTIVGRGWGFRQSSLDKPENAHPMRSTHPHRISNLTLRLQLQHPVATSK